MTLGGIIYCYCVDKMGLLIEVWACLISDQSLELRTQQVNLTGFMF